MTLTTSGLREAADRLIAAAAAPRQCDPVRDILGDHDIASAYEVQRLLTEHSLARGRRIVGQHLDSPNVNMVTCGGQATIPVVAAVAAAGTPVLYAEIVASIASKSAGPGTRANIDEFTETTAKALEVVGGANRAKAIIVLNPAEPPLIMRDTVHCLIGDADLDVVERDVVAMVDAVAYVPGYRLKQPVQFRRLETDDPADDLVDGGHGRPHWQVSVYLEVEGAAHYLPAYAGNLDIMTSAALRVGESLAARTEEPVR